MRILLCGEGITDIGKRRYDSKICEYYWFEGTIPIFIRRIISSYTDYDSNQIEFICYIDKELSIEEREGKKHSHAQRRRFKEGGDTFNNDYTNKGHVRVARLLIKKAESENETYDIVGMFKDSDKETGEKKNLLNAKKKHDEVVSQIHEGFNAELKNTEKDISFAIVPIRILENWLLSDPNAISEVNERGKKPKITDYKNPEEIWGDKGGNYPKQVLSNELSKCNTGSSTYEPDMYNTIAKSADLDLIRKKCGSFDAFCKELLSAVSYVKNYK